MQDVHIGVCGLGYHRNLPAVTPHPLPHMENGGKAMWLKSKTTGLSEQNGLSEKKKEAGAPCLIDDVERNMCRSSRKSHLLHLNKRQSQTVTPSRRALSLYAPPGFQEASTLMYNITQAQKLP